MMFLLSSTLGFIFLTPLGWIGMICFGVCAIMIRDMINGTTDNDRMRDAYMEVRMRIGRFETVEEVKEFLNEQLGV